MPAELRQDKIDGYFESLRCCLINAGSLPTSSGVPRCDATADEFMLMGVEGYRTQTGFHDAVWFKHRGTRNYLGIVKGSIYGPYVLTIPHSTAPWYGGTFDALPTLDEFALDALDSATDF